ncbi:MAG: response regulator transcription factor [Melioribacteraceae bacterium]|nr:response regulator transcription factor [Melioribacteraceae bacterium]
MNILIKENHVDWQNFLSTYKPRIDYVHIANKFKQIAFDNKLSREIFDIFIFDINGDPVKEIGLLKKLKQNNPNLKSIVLTSESNRKYWSQMALKTVDLFLFREFDLGVLGTVINQTNLRITQEEPDK